MMRRWRHCALGIAMVVGAIHESPAAVIWPAEIARIESGLQAADLAQRRAAANRLADLPAATLARLLPAVLDDPDPEVRLLGAAAVRSLGAYGFTLSLSKGHTPLQIGRRVATWLRDGDWRLRHAAADLLMRMPDAAAIPDLVRSLGDSEAAVRGQVVQALVASAQRDAVLPLLGRVDDPDPAVREQVLTGLSLLGDPRATLPLIGKLQDQRPNVRIGAARALGRLRDARAIPALMLAFSDSDNEVKVAVAGALAELQAVQAAELLVATLQTTSDESVTQALLTALAQLKSPVAAAAVVQALSSGQDPSAQMAENALAGASDLLIEALTQCLAGQPSERVGNACASGLGRVGSARAGAGVGGLLLSAVDRGSVSKELALDVLAQLAPAQLAPAQLAPASPQFRESVLPRALALLEDANPQVRERAATLSVRLLDPAQPDGTAVDPLLRALGQARGSARLQQALLTALGRTGSVRASGALISYLDPQRPVAVRLAAIEGCGWTKGEGAANALLALLDDGDAQMRFAAALALRRLAAPATFAPLWQRLTKVPAQDREAVIVALSGPLQAATPAISVADLGRQIQTSRGRLRDALLESVSFMPAASGLALLSDLAKQADAATRAKIAEVASAYGTAAQGLFLGASLGGQDSDPALRANWAWALGEAGEQGLARLLALSKDADHAVAANAVAALARVHPRVGELAPLLCDFASDSRSYVRVNALIGLRLRAQRCAQGPERRVLVADPSASARRAAAQLIATVPSPTTEAEYDRIALARCREQETQADVANACQAPQPQPGATSSSEPITVFVVPRGGGDPMPQVPFALLTQSGFVRSGWTDRRGAIFERSAGTAALRLVVPPQFVTSD